MSKSSLESLSKKELTALVGLYETEGYAALKKLIETERLNIAKLSMSLLGDSVDSLALNLKHLQGQTYALKAIHQIVKKAYQDDKKREVASESREQRRVALESTRLARSAKKLKTAN